MTLLTVKNATLAFDSNIISQNINFEVNDCDYLCIVGENGAGKTTLMKTIMGLYKLRSGEIIFDSSFKKTEIGYLPQQKSIQKDFPATVMEVTLSGFVNKLGFLPFYSNFQKKTALDNLKKLNIANLKNKSYVDLSGGQKQRVLLARALCSTKKLLILDEPITGLDSKTTSDLYELVDYINKKENITIIMISHDIEHATKYASHILHLSKEPLFFGTKKDYINTSFYKSLLGGK